MKKLFCLQREGYLKVLLRDYGDRSGYSILHINLSSGEVFVKSDKRIQGQEKEAVETFKKLYGYGETYVEKTIENLLKK